MVYTSRVSAPNGGYCKIFERSYCLYNACFVYHPFWGKWHAFVRHLIQIRTIGGKFNMTRLAPHHYNLYNDDTPLIRNTNTIFFISG